MSTEATNPMIVQPPSDLNELLEFSRFLSSHTEPAVLLGPDGQQTALPLKIYDVLVKVVDAMQTGKAITVAPIDQQLTTQQAADLLGVSRPTLIKFLEEGALAFERLPSSRHRRIRLTDVEAFAEAQQEARRQALDELTADAVAGGLYDKPAEDYAEALAAARKKDG